MTNMIELHQVSKRHANGHESLREVTLHVGSNELVFLTGHSGAGKTTLLKLMSLLEKPTKGRLLLNGENVCDLAPSRIPYFRRSIGLVLQTPRLLPRRTIFDNVALPLVISGFSYPEIKKRVHAALENVALIGKEKLRPEELSAGEQQRVNIARALIHKPPILLADEPTGNLDPELAHEIMSLFELFNKTGVCVVIATHDINLITRIGGRVLTLRGGSLVGDLEEQTA